MVEKVKHIFKCLQILTMTDKWLHAYDFNSYRDVFIGHRGCARISDTQKRYPYLVEVQQDPVKKRLYIYRLKWENIDDAMDKLRQDDPNAHSFLRDVLINKGMKWKEYKMVARETPEHTIIMEKQLLEVK